MNQIDKMTRVKVGAIFFLTIISLSQSTDSQYSNDSIEVYLNNKYSPLADDSPNINSSRNFQSRPLEDITLQYPDKDEHSEAKDFVNDKLDTNLTNYDDEVPGTPSTDDILEYMYPKSWTWALIFFHCVVFVVGLFGNCLVCVAVYRNRTMRTVTNYFIVNLAVADFLVILFCLPPSVVWDVTSTWWFGTAMCKTVLYLQVRNALFSQNLMCTEIKCHNMELDY